MAFATHRPIRRTSVACVVIAVGKREGLAAVTVTALDGTKEPTDQQFSLLKKKESVLLLILSKFG